jgi:hypothetical protein
MESRLMAPLMLRLFCKKSGEDYSNQSPRKACTLAHPTKKAMINMAFLLDLNKSGLFFQDQTTRQAMNIGCDIFDVFS